MVMEATRERLQGRQLLSQLPAQLWRDRRHIQPTALVYIWVCVHACTCIYAHSAHVCVRVCVCERGENTWDLHLSPSFFFLSLPFIPRPHCHSQVQFLLKSNEAGCLVSAGPGWVGTCVWPGAPGMVPVYPLPEQK